MADTPQAPSSRRNPSRACPLSCPAREAVCHAGRGARRGAHFTGMNRTATPPEAASHTAKLSPPVTTFSSITMA